MAVDVLYFAWLRSRVGLQMERLDLPAGVATVGTLIDHLAARSPGHGRAFADRSVLRVAVNQEFAEPDATIRDGDEVAFFPPITGG